jgi:glycosyltransferase involved in cell wall biosynthesis
MKALSNHVINKIYHIEVRKGNFKVLNGKNGDSSFYFILYLPFEIWRIYEVISFLLVLWVIIKNNKREFKAINFHIAYPNCTYLHILKRWINVPIAITEHWSGYHFDFNILNPKKRRKIQEIFHQNTPVITVSNALLKDIKNFSKADFPGYIVPNMIDTKIFNYTNAIQPSENIIFFMVSQWKWPKDPFTVIKAWRKVIRNFPNAKLRIGGYGKQVNEMVGLIEESNLHEWIYMMGQLTSEQIAFEMLRARAFIHCSEYETFSVVCAEALCCGTPVIASNVGGISDLIHSGNGILVPENTQEAFFQSISDFLNKGQHFDHENISREASNRFSGKQIGEKYYSILSKIISE